MIFDSWREVSRFSFSPGAAVPFACRSSASAIQNWWESRITNPSPRACVSASAPKSFTHSSITLPNSYALRVTVCCIPNVVFQDYYYWRSAPQDRFIRKKISIYPDSSMELRWAKIRIFWIMSYSFLQGSVSELAFAWKGDMNNGIDRTWMRGARSCAH